MHWNCAHRERSFWPRFFGGCCAGSAVCGSFVLSSIKRVSPSLPRGKAALHPARRWFPHPVRLNVSAQTIYAHFIIHPARNETSTCTKFGQFFHALFTKAGRPYPAAAGFPRSPCGLFRRSLGCGCRCRPAPRCTPAPGRSARSCRILPSAVSLLSAHSCSRWISAHCRGQ